MQDAIQIKEKIISILKMNGPSLPVHIARGINLSILFTSAFLSELYAEKRIKFSFLRVGSSPVYFLEGQESKLENFSQHLKSKEKDAFLRLKEKKFLKDSEQEPAIRVALRAIKDFAIPFQNQDTKEIYWRFFITPEEEFNIKEKKAIVKQSSAQKAEPIIKEIKTSETIEKQLDIFDTKKETPKRAKKRTIKISKKAGEKFFNDVKEFLNKNSIELLDISEFGKKEILLKVRKKETELLAIAFNKKRVTETDIINAHKKASELNLPYIVLSKGEVLKKITSLIEAVKTLSGIKNINEKVSD